jgi:AraC family transcriptional activator of mtrCDE
MARPGSGAIVRSLGDTLLVLLLRTLLGERSAAGRAAATDER